MIKGCSKKGNKTSKRETITKDIIEEYFSGQETPKTYYVPGKINKVFLIQP